MTDFKKDQTIDTNITGATIKLYDENPYETSFSAEITEVRKNDNCIYLVLDRTLFFPEEGGQSADTGEIESFEVVDVQISNDIITHIYI